VTRPFVPSPYQQAVFDHFAKPTGSVVVKAVAGSGKSTTIARAITHLPARATATLLAFNKDASVELAAKVAENDPTGRWAKSVRTFHSAGMGAYRYWRNSVRVDDAKVFNIIDRAMTVDQARVYGSFIRRMVGLAKSAGLGYLVHDTPSNWADLRDHFEVYLEIADDERYSEADALSLCSAVLSASRADLGTIDFDDMLYMPLVHNVKFFQVDCLIVDEAQDTNAVQLALMKRMVKPKGWVCAVGDPAQAIYGFRGADSSALDNIRRSFGAKELPLTVSYRCAKSVVARAQTLVPYIEAHDDAPEGSVSVVPSPQGEAESVAFYRDLRDDDFVLCRNTAPLVSLAYALIGNGRPARVLGRDIGKGLTALISRMKAANIEELVDRLEDFRSREVAKWQSKHNEARAQSVDDKVECITVLIDGLPEYDRTIPALVSAIDALFTDRPDAGAITLSTVHKAKGLERGRVFVWRADLMPSPWARQDWAKQQEDNLQYVAWTRAKTELILVYGE
jgi:superfamily I DNA/RNA helicase